MAAGLESALKQTLREVLAEVASNFMQEWKATNRSNPPSSAPADHNLLLTARETAKRLAISERHLHGLTKAGQIPCVRVGSAVRYNVESIRDWIRKAESTERPVRSNSVEPNHVSPKVERRTPQRVTNVVEPQARRGTGSNDASRSKQKKPKVPKPQANDKRHVESEKRISPLSVLLNELGIDSSSLPPLTNGDLMRFAEVDIATMHGWKYLGRSLPEEAMNKLTNHLRRLAKEGRDKE